MNMMEKVFRNRILLVILLLLSVSMVAQNKPVIGLSATVGDRTSTSVPLTYVEAVIRAGGVPIVLPIINDKEMLSMMLDKVDALIMTGGEDVDPLKWYGEEPVNAMGGIAPERDEFDITLIKMAIERDLPVLGICRGLQVMNVAFGGTLYQDIPSQVKGSIKHNQRAPGNYGTHSIKIESGSILREQIGVDSVAVNSFHHQSVKDLAPGFRATAFAIDGVVEAIEMIGNEKVFGVQFHPEGFVSSGDDTFLGVFRYLIKLAETNK